MGIIYTSHKSEVLEAADQAIKRALEICGGVINRLLAGENVNAEEVYATPEVQHVLAMRTPGLSMDTGDLLNLQKRNCTIRIRLTPLNVT